MERKTAEAKKYLDRLLATNPDHVDGLLVRGLIPDSDGRFEAALDDLRRAERLVSPADTERREALALGYRCTGHAGDAVRVLRGLTATAPGNAGTWASLGGAYGDLAAAARGRESSGGQGWEHSVAPVPMFIATLREARFLAWVRLAWHAFTRAYELEPDNVEHRLDAAETFERLRLYRIAIAQLSHAEAIDPDCVDDEWLDALRRKAGR
jgi:tetratricopeptide (TPR) repeat protein